MAIVPFRLEFSERAIADLHRRIDAARWPQLAFATGWSAGTDDGVLRALVAYWRRDFDWFAMQERLNRYPHVRGEVQGEETHAVLLARGGAPRLPLLLLHGWPGSFIELLPAGERLVEGVEGSPAYDVVIPSLPGFGLSEPPRAAGMHPGRIAERMHQLMRALGYERYGVQGGDWGAIVGVRLAHAHPEAVVALHLNFTAGLLPAPAAEGGDEEAKRQQQERARWRARETAYSALQGAKPQTLAYALTDSPVGLLAWMLEKFWAWSDHGDDLWQTFDRDEVLANVTLYWLTGTALSAARTYYESASEDPPFLPRERLEVPTGFARFPAEPWLAERDALQRSYRLERYAELPRGGHFAALEQPQLFAAEVASFFSDYATG